MADHTCDCTGHSPEDCSPHCHPPKRIPRSLKFRWEVIKARFALRKHHRAKMRKPWLCVACGCTVIGPPSKHNCGAY